MTTQTCPEIGAVSLHVDPRLFPRTSLILGVGCAILAAAGLSLVISAPRSAMKRARSA